MEQRIARKLMGFYYGMLVLAVLAATGMYYAISRDWIEPFSPMTLTGQIIQYLVIGYVLLSVPGALWFFKRHCNKLKKAEEDIRYARYYKGAIWRIVLIGLGMSLGIAAFYLLQGYQSMLLCAGISAIGLVFCKPTARKIELELLDENPDITTL